MSEPFPYQEALEQVSKIMGAGEALSQRDGDLRAGLIRAKDAGYDLYALIAKHWNDAIVAAKSPVWRGEP
jgi:hypothetical protein